MAEFVERRIQSNGNTVNFNIDRSQPYVDTTVNGQRTRIYGSQQQLDTYQNRKPDGTPKLPVDTPTRIPEGSAVTVSELPAAITEVVPNAAGNPSSSTPVSSSSGVNLAQVVPNPLEQYSSLAPLWTLAALTPEQYNNPTIYRKSTDALKHVIMAAGGRFDAQRTNTLYGTPEYFLNDFEMKAVINASASTGNTNALGFSFTLYEPYSMGTLLQSMQNAALNAGYTNYLECPYVLRLDFKGYDDTGKIISSVKPKFFVMKFKTVKFQVTEGGSTYEVKAFPFNHTGFLDTINTLYNDISIGTGSPGTVRDALVSGEKSLTKYLNDNEQLLVRQNRIKVPDQYEIQFPQNSAEVFTGNSSQANSTARATIDPLIANAVRRVTGRAQQTNTNFGQNAIGGASFGFGIGDGGNYPFAKEGDVITEDGIIVRDQMSINPTEREFIFSQGQPLTDIIVQTILSSDYAKAAMDPANLTPEGYIKWFRIDVQVEFLDFDDLIGDFARKISYRVIPFYVHHTVFLSSTTSPVGYNELEKKIAKHYEYIYTGQNVNVLDFEIKINNLFFAGTNPSVEAETRNEQEENGLTVTTGQDTSVQAGANPEAQISNTGRSRPRRDPSLIAASSNGSGVADTERKVAEMFNNAFINSTTADLIQVDLEILGDTYWMVESGFANHFVEPTNPTDQILSDGTVNYEGSDVFIYISFRTPVDIDTENLGSGLYKFPAGSVSPFSGIYKVTKCLNKFSDGNFTQELRCIRMQGQALDYGGEALPGDRSGALAIGIGGNKSPAQDIANAATAIQSIASGDWISNLDRIFSAAEASGFTPTTSNPTAASTTPEIVERRIQSNGTLVNFNIDRKLPSRLVNIRGTETRVYGTEAQLTEKFGAAPSNAEDGA